MGYYQIYYRVAKYYQLRGWNVFFRDQSALDFDIRKDGTLVKVKCVPSGIALGNAQVQDYLDLKRSFGKDVPIVVITAGPVPPEMLPPLLEKDTFILNYKMLFAIVDLDTTSKLAYQVDLKRTLQSACVPVASSTKRSSEASLF